ncbi:MAG: hypothetical protein ACK56F_18105, partial [bacterium]
MNRGIVDGVGLRRLGDRRRTAPGHEGVALGRGDLRDAVDGGPVVRYAAPVVVTVIVDVEAVPVEDRAARRGALVVPVH